MKRRIMIAFAAVTLALAMSAAGCQTKSEPAPDAPDPALEAAHADVTPTVGSIYFSICMTTNINGIEPGEKYPINNYVYSLQDGTARKVDASVPYESQYPLAAYSVQDNAIYFSKRIEYSDGGHGDQLAVFRLDTKETEVLTDDIFSINEIIPLRDRIVIAACPFGDRGEQLMYYDKKTGALSSSRLLPEVEKAGDTFVSFLSYNPLSGLVVAPAFSLQERDQKTDDFNSRRIRTYLQPDTTLYRASVRGAQPPTVEEMFRFDDGEMEFRAAGLSEDGRMIVALRNTEKLKDGSEAEFEEQVQSWFLLDPQHPDVRQEVTLPEPIVTISSNLCFLAETDSVYFIGADKEDSGLPVGLYRFHLGTGKLDLLFETPEDSYINNFCALAS